MSSGIGSAAAASSLADQLGERGAALRLARSGAAFERTARVALVEHLARLHVDRLAEPALGAQRHQRRDLVRQRRHAEDRGEQQRHRRGEAPADHLESGRAARPRRCGRPARRRSSIACASAGSRTSRRASSRAPARPSRSTPSRRREMIELVVGPAHEHVACSSASRTTTPSGESSTSTGRRALVAPSKKMPVPAARHAQIPPTLSASASPSPTAELAAPAALDAVKHINARQLDRLETCLPEAQSHRRLVDRRIGERNNDIGADQDRGRAAARSARPCRAKASRPPAIANAIAAPIAKTTPGDECDPHEAQVDRVDGAACASCDATVNSPKRNPEIHQRSTIAWNTG